MMKQHKGKLMVSSALVLAPILAGLILWDRLPERMTTHWGVGGTADGWSGKPFAVFGLPLILLAVHWLCVWGTSLDPGNREQNRKVSGMVLWICPVISVFTNGIVYAAALDLDVNVMALTWLLLGVMFLAIGNYLPKCRQNHTIGIRIPWTLNSEENWSATHRMAGRLWTVGGLVLLAGCLLPERLGIALMVIVLPVLVAAPMIYSYSYHRRQLRAGHEPTGSGTKNTLSKKAKIGSLVGLAAVLVLVSVLMFTGDIQLRYNETSFTVEADYYQDLTVEYAAVDSIEYRENDRSGMRTFGFGSARLLMGQFKNDEFGDYTRYSYTRCGSCVVVTAGGNTLVLSGPDEEATRKIFEELTTRQ